MELNREQLAILDHTAHRAAGGCYCGDSPDMQVLVAAGLMESAGRKSFVPDEYFRMTGKGREALRSANAPRQTAEVVGCPFCGETPTVEAWHGGGHDKHMVACSNDACHATSAVYGATRADAIRRWNTRKAKTPDVDPEEYEVWFAMLFALADSCKSLVAAIEQISGKCQTREQRAALIIGRSALAALQRLESAGRVGDGNGDTTAGRGAR